MLTPWLLPCFFLWMGSLKPLLYKRSSCNIPTSFVAQWQFPQSCNIPTSFVAQWQFPQNKQPRILPYMILRWWLQEAKTRFFFCSQNKSPPSEITSLISGKSILSVVDSRSVTLCELGRLLVRSCLIDIMGKVSPCLKSLFIFFNVLFAVSQAKLYSLRISLSGKVRSYKTDRDVLKPNSDCSLIVLSFDILARHRLR